MKLITSLYSSSKGAAFVEYVLLMALVSFIAIGSVNSVGKKIDDQIYQIGYQVNGGGPMNTFNQGTGAAGGSTGSGNLPPIGAPTGPLRPGSGSNGIGGSGSGSPAD